ncbi:MAG: class I SAM-dependent methyltransferase [Actinomycetia bacterium]|nr:class I SAM-dependent methyltransferase [Actinomycetes bacterium]
MAGAIFEWATPWFVHEARRWTQDDARAIASRLAPVLGAGGRVLDVGGGTGMLAALLANVAACDVTVLDSSAAMLRHAQGSHGVSVVLGDAAAMPFEDAAFDAVIAVDALHHMSRQSDVAAQIARVLRPGGAVFIAEPDPAALAVRMSRTLERMLGEPGGMLTPDEMVALFGSVGIVGEVERQGGMGYAFVARLESQADR